MSNNSAADNPGQGRNPSDFIVVDFSGLPSSPPLKPKSSTPSETTAEYLPKYGMSFPDEALSGLAGNIVKKLLPETESHAAALLAHILARFGNIVGRTAYHQVEDSKHYGNLFFVIVGATSKARKGTANNRIDAIFKGIDMNWERRELGGFGSGEGVINAVRDDQEVGFKGKTKIIPGVEDKRLLIREGEFSKILAVGKREGNLLSQVLRDAWDGKTLRNNVKNNPQTASDPHISAVCDITQGELSLRLDQADQYNGFANRFLWLFVERLREKPFGGVDQDWTRERQKLRKALLAARQRERIFMSEAARTMWRREYPTLSKDLGGIVGGITGRAEAQVLRLALVYALLDQSDHIQSVHLKSALWLWDYAVRSVEHIFAKHGVMTEEQKKMVELARGVAQSKTDFYRLFQKHRKATDIEDDIRALVEKKLMKFLGWTERGGRNVRVWRSI